MCGTQAHPGAGAHTVLFEDQYIVYNENKRRTKLKETEWRKNEFI